MTNEKLIRSELDKYRKVLQSSHTGIFTEHELLEMKTIQDVLLWVISGSEKEFSEFTKLSS